MASDRPRPSEVADASNARAVSFHAHSFRAKSPTPKASKEEETDPASRNAAGSVHRSAPATSTPSASRVIAARALPSSHATTRFARNVTGSRVSSRAAMRTRAERGAGSGLEFGAPPVNRDAGSPPARAASRWRRARASQRRRPRAPPRRPRPVGTTRATTWPPRRPGRPPRTGAPARWTRAPRGRRRGGAQLGGADAADALKRRRRRLRLGDGAGADVRDDARERALLAPRARRVVVLERFLRVRGSGALGGERLGWRMADGGWHRHRRFRARPGDAASAERGGARAPGGGVSDAPEEHIRAEPAGVVIHAGGRRERRRGDAEPVGGASRRDLRTGFSARGEGPALRLLRHPRGDVVVHDARVSARPRGTRRKSARAAFGRRAVAITDAREFLKPSTRDVERREKKNARTVGRRALFRH